MLTSQRGLLEDMRKLDIEVSVEDVQVGLANLCLQPSLLDRIKEAQKEDPERETLLRTITDSEKTELCQDEYEVIRYGTRLWIPDQAGLRKEVLQEAHSSSYDILLGSTKMYKDLKKAFLVE